MEEERASEAMEGEKVERLSLPPERKPERLAGVATQFEIHDRQQLEVRFNYSFGDDGAPQAYVADVYIFVPKNVGVHRGNYSKEQFYADVTALLRLDADPIPLEKLSSPTEVSSPLFRIRTAIDELRGGKVPSSRPLVVHVKMYAFLLTIAVRGELRRLEKMLLRERRARKVPPRDSLVPAVSIARPSQRTRFERELVPTLDRIAKALQAFRRARADLWPFEEVCHRSLADALRAADEYLSVYVEDRMSHLAAVLEADASCFDGSAFVPRALQRLAAFAAAEAAVRERYGYATLRDGAERYAGEYFTYRASLIKKTVQQALYLDARGSAGDRLLRNAVSGVAAGLAATWAVATQLPGGAAALSWDAKLLFSVAAVLAYVAKDRIKALTSEYLLQRVRQFDHAAWLQGSFLEELGLGGLQARIRESARFLSSGEVSEELLRLRATRRTVRRAELGNEEVLHYRKLVEVGAEEEGPPLPHGYRVRDIVRINMRQFLVRLDDPVDRVRFFDPRSGRFVERALPKVYHLNLVVRVQRVDASGKGFSRLQLLRVVLDKEGIVRVDEVVSNPPEPVTVAPPKFPRRFAVGKRK